MAHVRKRKPQTEGGAVRYRVRYIDPAGRERSKSFRLKGEADRFAHAVEADKARGTYVDPAAGRMTLEEYGAIWLAAQTFDPSTHEATALRLRLHVYPYLGKAPLGGIRPSQVQAWLKALQQSLAPRYVRVIHANLSAVLSAAVDDDRIGKNPCKAGSVRLPRHEPGKIKPWTAEQVFAVHGALPERFRLMSTLAAGCGLRQGEVFGLAVDDVDFLRGVVHVQRQIKIVGNRLVFARPKGRKTRDVPLPETVALELAAHLQAFPARVVPLPWEVPTGKAVEATLVLSSREAGALNRNYINAKVWKPALGAAGLPATRQNGMHALRHFYASVLLDAGESVRALSDYLGHSDPGFTLRTYTHLMPASEDRTRKAVDRVLGGSDSAADGLVTAYRPV
jgi:integrase